MSKREKRLKRMRKGIGLFYVGLFLAGATGVLVFVLLFSGTAGEWGWHDQSAIGAAAMAIVSFMLCLTGTLMSFTSWIGGLAELNSHGAMDGMAVDIGAFVLLLLFLVLTGGSSIIVTPAVWYIMHSAVMKRLDGPVKEQAESAGRKPVSEQEDKKDLYSLGEVK